MSVLDVLTQIQSNQDSTLAFRYSCRAGMCGSCSMRVNGKNSWTCRIMAEQFLKTGLTLEPRPNFPVIRDLAVDMKPFFDHYRRVIPQFVPKIPGEKNSRTSNRIHGNDAKSTSTLNASPAVTALGPVASQVLAPNTWGLQPSIGFLPRIRIHGIRRLSLIHI